MMRVISVLLGLSIALATFASGADNNVAKAREIVDRYLKAVFAVHL